MMTRFRIRSLMPTRFPLAIGLLFLMSVGLAGCGDHGGNSAPVPAPAPSGPQLVILSGSENKTLEPLIQTYAQQHNVQITMQYLGSVDMMLRLQQADPGADAVWPANSLWISLGDTGNKVKHAESIMRTPVVLGVKRSVAERLGWIGKPVHVQDILDAAQAGKLRYMMTSATQSNSGASAYFGYLYAFAGRPEVLTSKDLDNPKVRARIKSILGTVNRSAGSSGWLKDLFLSQFDQYDGMVNYEALIIEANQALTQQGKEPLYCIYPVDGLAIADSPLGYVDRGDPAKEQVFLDLQKYLLSQPIQDQILQSGRRVGLVGMGLGKASPAVFNPEWGIDPKRIINPIRFPDRDVIRQALDLYQTSFRKPSYTVYCIDFSGSMADNGGQTGVKAAMRILLDQTEARKQLLQASPQDQTVVIPFNSAPLAQWTAGGDQASMMALLGQINALNANDGTDIYEPVIRAMRLLAARKDLENYFPAIILMTDGRSNTNRFDDLMAARNGLHFATEVPVHAIMFGDADPSELNQIADATSGKVFDGSKDLVSAFREARGYN